MRKHLIAANWKMYKTPRECVEFFEAFLPMVAGDDRVEIAVFPSLTSVPAALAAVQGSSVRVGAQNMHWMECGAYTGETSPAMLLAIGVTHVLIGHSERRQFFNETDETVNLKLKAAIAHGLMPMVCVGENLNERDGGHTEEVLRRQVTAALRGVAPEACGGLTFAYEPVWAIGTGKTATPGMAEESHRIIRMQIAESLNEEVAEATRILVWGIGEAGECRDPLLHGRHRWGAGGWGQSGSGVYGGDCAWGCFAVAAGGRVRQERAGEGFTFSP